MKNNWIKCGEKMPENNTRVIVCDQYDSISMQTYINDKYKWDGMHSDAIVTHWMPLPEPPVKHDPDNLTSLVTDVGLSKKEGRNFY